MAKLAERFSVTTNDGRSRSFRERKLPRIILAEPMSSTAGAALKFRALRCVLKSNTLRDVTADKLHTFLRVIAAFQKLGC